MRSLFKDFILDQDGKFSLQFGKVMASSLSGFLAGAVSASIVWFAVVWFVKMFDPSF